MWLLMFLLRLQAVCASNFFATPVGVANGSV